MSDQPESQRFKPEMPRIPGVAPVPGAGLPKSSNLTVITVLLVVLFVVALGAHYALRPKPIEPTAVAPPPQLQVPTPAPDPDFLLPIASGAQPVVATIAEMARPWSSKSFMLHDPISNENVPALLIRLPGGSASQASGYWGLSMNPAYGSCRLEYLTDLAKLRADYGYRAANHPMVGNPCSHTVFDPAKMTMLPGNIWVRGAIVQGSDIRPPLGVEIEIKGKDILAIRRE
jgi:hypothetical protein